MKTGQRSSAGSAQPNDETARVAYELHEKREKIYGYDLADWLEAERSILKKYAKEIEAELEKTPQRKT